MLGGNLLMNYLAVAEYCFADRPGGASRVAWDIAKAMQRRGHSVTLLCYRHSDQTPEGVELLDGIRVVRFEKRQLPGWHPARLRAIVETTAAACTRWLGDRHFEVVHVHSALQGLGVMTALGTQPRYVNTVHSPIVLEQEIIWRSQGWTGRLKLLLGRGLLVKAERRMLAASAAIHTLSAFTRAELERAYRVGRRVSVIPHWYTPRGPRLSKSQARDALGWPRDAKIFFTVRGAEQRYGLDVAIRALGPLTQELDCHFYLAGDGQLRPQLEALAATFRRTASADERIHFMGRISDEQLETSYAAADLFILPTTALECFGLIMIEAMTFGCPVLATDVAAIPETLGPILPGFMVPAGDVAALQLRAREFLQATLPRPDRQTLINYAGQQYGEATVVAKLFRLFGTSA
jgi:glycosyltransferase involved in cell wall biosynthesis